MTGAGPSPRILALSGGVGGAKLALGLADELRAGELAVLVNTADDFEHLGLRICPDIDTLLYTLSGRASTARGWGLEGETWHAMEALEALGGDSWFRLGDRDLATHLWRSARLREGLGLGAVTAELAARLGVRSQVLPMSDQPVRTVVQTDEGELSFQHYFVRRRCEPKVCGFHFHGLAEARPNAEAMALVSGAVVDAVVICPSNPFVSVDPILSLHGLWQALRDAPLPVWAVSPIIDGSAVKGPAAKMMRELGLPVSAAAVAEHYRRRYPELLDGFIVDRADGTLVDDISEPDFQVIQTDTLMRTRDDKRRLARAVLQAIAR